MPPMYWSTGIHFAACTGSKARSGVKGSAKRKKYHDESQKVSIVSASRRAGEPQTGHVVDANSSWVASGDWPFLSSTTSSGARIGS